jgi:putative ABC transport system permease protein
MCNFVYLNLPYLQDLIGCQGRVSFVLIITDDSSFVPEISSKAEALFRNYPVEITSITQKSFLESIVNRIKVILIAFRLIGWIAIISTFLLVANCIALSIRERTIEIGVMRVLGFSRIKILALVLSESIMVALGGGMVGALLAYLLFAVHHIEIPATVPLVINSDIYLVFYALFISILIGFLGGIFPVINSVRMKPSDAIRNIG